MKPSPQSIAKKKQNYQDKPMQKRCRVCRNLDVKTTKTSWGYFDEKLKCKIGGFAVKANSICDRFTSDQ